MAGFIVMLLMSILSFGSGSVLGKLVFSVATPIGVLFLMAFAGAKGKAKAVSEPLSGKDILACWKFSPVEWASYQGRDLGKNTTYRIILIAPPFLAFGLTYLLSTNHRIEWACLAGLVVAVWACYMWISESWSKWLRQKPAQVIFGINQVLIGREHVSFSLDKGTSDNMELTYDDGLAIYVRYWSNFGRFAIRQHLRIPVPQHALVEAKNVMDRYGY